MHSSPTSPSIPRRRSAPAPAQRRALPPPSCHIPAAQTHALRLRHAFFADLTAHSSPKACSRPSTATRPSRALPLPHAAPTHPRRPHNPFPPKTFTRPRTATHPPRSPDARPQAARCIPRRPHNPFPTEGRRPSPQRRPASPSVPLRAQKNGTAQWMCDAECLGRPSLRSVIGGGEPRAVRRRCGALACRRGA